MSLNPPDTADPDQWLRLKKIVDEGVRRVLFVCTGNICRSPVAHYALLHELEQVSVQGIAVESAGTLDIGSQPAKKDLVEIASPLGVDLSPHQSTHIAEEHIVRSDIIFVMELAHRKEILKRFPGCGDKLFLLSLFDYKYNGVDIQDPLGRGGPAYRHSFQRICQLVRELAGMFP